MENKNKVWIIILVVLLIAAIIGLVLLNNQLSGTKASLIEANTALTTEQSNSADLTTQLEEAKTTNEELTAELEAALTTPVATDTPVPTEDPAISLQAQIDTLTANLDAANARVAELEAAAESAGIDVPDPVVEVQPTAEAQTGESQTEGTEAQTTEGTEAQTGEGQTTVEITTVDVVAACETDDAAIAAVNAELENAKTQLSDAQNIITAKESELTAAAADLAAKTTELTDTQTALEAAQTELAAKTTELTDTQTALETAQTELATVQADLATSQADLATAQTALTDTETTLANVQSELDETKATLAATEDALADKTAEADAYKLDRTLEDGEAAGASITDEAVTVAEDGVTAVWGYENDELSSNNSSVSITVNDEVIYASDMLKPGETISDIKLSKQLAAGTYEGIASITVYNEEGIMEHTTRLPIVINVK